MSFQKTLIIGLLFCLGSVPKAENKLLVECSVLSHIFCNELSLNSQTNLQKCTLAAYKTCLSQDFDKQTIAQCMKQLATKDGALLRKSRELQEEDLHPSCQILFSVVREQHASKDAPMNDYIKAVVASIEKELNNKDWGPFTSGEEATYDLNDNPNAIKYKIQVTGKTGIGFTSFSESDKGHSFVVTMPFIGSYTRTEFMRRKGKRIEIPARGGNFSGIYAAEYKIRGDDVKLMNESLQELKSTNNNHNPAKFFVDKSIKPKLKEIIE